ncbi:MAG: hypothetical protein V7763_11620 [Sulfitobacter sp.]|uniref:hypothetical protein n=1 Tax=Sulfitobacter sp. TaxID=1903071 RepID=UPI000C0E0420|nr:hypothetical protein [Roseobacter sp.]MBV50782.1 hypothetical protein [Roseobacter sp.]PHR02454.1 MAG: hypothetical protein COB29_13920 [Sulfitobacter sp.]
MTDEFRYSRQGRNPGTMIVVAAIWAVLIAAYFWLDAAPLLLGVLALFTVPALWDQIKAPTAGLTLTPTTLGWHSGIRTARVAVTEISRVRLDTRLDFSVRATVVLRSGRKLRIPYEATPPHQALEAQLNANDIKTERHHFSLRQ